MSSFKTVLLISNNRSIVNLVTQCVSKSFKLIKAENEETALKIIVERQYIDAVLFDASQSSSPSAFFNKLKEYNSNLKVPFIFITDSENATLSDYKKYGFTIHFVSLPLDEVLLLEKLKDCIINFHRDNYNRLIYNSEYDSLTGVFNKNTFFEQTRTLLDSNPNQKYVFARFDISRFSLINSYYGSEEGDRLLKYIARNLKRYAKRFKSSTFGRISSDIFAICMPFTSKEAIDNSIISILPFFRGFNTNYDISPCFGIYIITDPSLPVYLMYDKAKLAAKNCKNKYVINHMFYDEHMEEVIQNEQEIINEMNTALKEEQFVVYFQPKYSLYKRCVNGAEALVRWNHPVKGIISPSKFIPIFEKNGFISKLDYYVWERVCQLLRKWIDCNYQVNPVSVNVSRVDLYNPNFVQIICNLVDKYNIPHSLINLELTESAYTDNPSVILNIITELQKKGFIIYMDDFGSGYSSLNVLKDINVDVLKLDMKFLSEASVPGRGENIIASVIRMAKWLNIPTVAEGVEKKNQVNFLYEVGCEYAQGYYFAKPMPTAEYEKLITLSEIKAAQKSKANCDSIWVNDEQIEKSLTNETGAAAICEYYNNSITFYRVNNYFNDFFNYNENVFSSQDITEFVANNSKQVFLTAFRTAISSKGTAECDYEHIFDEKCTSWVHLVVDYKNRIGNHHILIAHFNDITAKKQIETDLIMHKLSLSHCDQGINKMLCR